MILRAAVFNGYLDISAPEVLGADLTWNFRRTVMSGEVFRVPDEYYRFPNIKNAINAGLLEVISYDSDPDALVINANKGAGGIRSVNFDLQSATETAEAKIINGVPCLAFGPDVESSSRWTVALPENYTAGNNIYVSAYWSASNSSGGNVQWNLGYRCIPTGGSLVGDITKVSYLQAVPAELTLATTGNFLFIPASAITSGLITISLIRNGDLDTFNGQAYVHLVRMSY
jgi:hypothetical protein